MQPILVTGGTGNLGRSVVRELRDAGREARVLSRRPGPDHVVGDLTTGAGIDDAVRGAGAIVHCATDTRSPRNDVTAARTLIEAAHRHGAPHLVFISIVGVDRVPLGYYRAKREAEQLVTESGLPWTILRATQFHDLALTLTRLLARMPVLVVPAGTSMQPVDAGEVAARLVRLALDAPVGWAPELGGPEVVPFADLARTYLRVTGRRRPVLPVRLPGAVARGYRDGGHLTPAHADGRRTFEDFLAARVRVGHAP
jgi:uncharacterized protein YbjT (DUF2867 family)